MAANRWSPLSVFLAGGVSGAALIGVYAHGSATQMQNNAGHTQHERDSEPRREEALLLERVDSDLTNPGRAAEPQGPSVVAKGDSTAAVAPGNGVEAAERKSENEAPAEAGRSLAQVLAGLEAEYRRQVSTPDPPSPEKPLAVEAASPSQPLAVEAASPARPPSASAALSASGPAEHEPKHVGPDAAPARNVSTVPTAEETLATNQQHLVAEQIQQLTALQQLAMAQQVAASQQLAIAQQLALLSYLQLVPVPPASASPRAPQERRLPRGAFVTRFPSSENAISNTNNPSGFYWTPTILVR
jgi:hypothetical protein